MLDHSVRISYGRRCQKFETDGKFTNEFSKSGSQVGPYFRRCKCLPWRMRTDLVFRNEHCGIRNLNFVCRIDWTPRSSECLPGGRTFVFETRVFFVDFVTTRSIPQHEEQTHMRVLPPNKMNETLLANRHRLGRALHLQKKMQVFFEISHGRTLLLQPDRKNKGKPHWIRWVVFSQNPLFANATSKSREQRSLCYCNAFSSPQLPARTTPNDINVVWMTLINDCACFRWCTLLSLSPR